MRVQLSLLLEIDTEEYPLPCDGTLDDEFEEAIRNALFDMNGVQIVRMLVKEAKQ